MVLVLETCVFGSNTKLVVKTAVGLAKKPKFRCCFFSYFSMHRAVHGISGKLIKFPTCKNCLPERLWKKASFIFPFLECIDMVSCANVMETCLVILVKSFVVGCRVE